MYSVTCKILQNISGLSTLSTSRYGTFGLEVVVQAYCEALHSAWSTSV